jgi:putative chitinase
MSNWTFDFTTEKLAQCVKRNKNPGALFEALEAVLPRYQINTVERVAAFLAQCGHESADFTVLQENLNYSAKGLHGTWPKRFVSEDAAAPYARNPEKIANKVYADRMGNGTEESGDGWTYRGRGAIQLTGKSNYQAFAETIEFTLEEAVAYTETLTGAIESAAWFWWKNNLNPIADDRNITVLTKKINGGTLGLEERKSHMIHNLTVLEG